MSLASSRVALTHVCSLERNASLASGDDGSGNPPPADWQPLADVPCRFWVDSGTEDVAERTTIAAVTDGRVIVPLGTDVTEADRVAQVAYRGQTVQDGPLGVRARLVRRDHIELLLVKVA